MTKLRDTKTALLRRTLLAGALSAIGLATAVKAQAADPALVDLQVINRETGQAARVWRHAGRLYVAGRPGARYGVRVTNNSARRVLVVMSVDGVNVLTGQTAGVDQGGYVFGPYESYDVNGWRKSDTEVAAFTFAPLSRSYAARTGRPGDVGVIGIAAFTERVVHPRSAAPTVAPQSRDQSASDAAEEVVITGSLAAAPPPAAASRGAPSVEAQRRSEKLGTGHGAREWSSVTTVAFQRASSYPQLVSRIEYDSVENLVAAGVIPRSPPAPPRPRPFPLSPNQYVPDPPYGR